MNDLRKLTEDQVLGINEVRCGNLKHLLALIQGEKPAERSGRNGWMGVAPVFVDEELADNEVRVSNRDGSTDVYIDGALQGE